MHFTAPANKSDTPTYRNVFTLCDNSGFFFLFCFSKLNARATPFAHRGQSCTTPALTAMQLHRI